jgi:hypothetical protein
MQTFSSVGIKFDAITCISALNYNRSPEELLVSLKNLYQALNSNGIVIIFNALVRDNSSKFEKIHLNTLFSRRYWVIKIGKWHRDSVTNYCTARFLLFIRDGWKFKFDIDRHRLYAFDTNEIITSLDKVGFKTHFSDVNSSLFIGLKK